MGKCSLETINRKEELWLNSFPLKVGSLKLSFASSWQNQMVTLTEAHEHECSASNQRGRLLAQAPHSPSPCPGTTPLLYNLRIYRSMGQEGRTGSSLSVPSKHNTAHFRSRCHYTAIQIYVH